MNGNKDNVGPEVEWHTYQLVMMAKRYQELSL